MTEVVVHLGEESRVLEAVPGETVLQLLRRCGYETPESPCGGGGQCGKCRVETSYAGGPKGTALACRTEVASGLELWLEAAGSLEVLTAEVAAGEASGPLGVAVDLGTTTLALALYDLQTGACLRTLGAANVQRPFGADVITRIEYGKENGFTELTRKLRRQVAELAERLVTGPGEIRRYVVTGNTVMLHFFAGLSPAGIAVAPYTPESFFDELCSVKEYGLPGAAGASVLLPPVLSGYLGADVTCGLLTAAEDWEEQKPRLFLDIGTNGEMALLTRGEILCCSAAAGPAFEGAGISRGMPALPGAVCGVRAENGELLCETVGGEAPRGICGSGLLDSVACLLELGRLEESGRLSGGEAVLTPGVTLTQQDLRALQLAKGAIAGGLSTLLHHAGLPAGAVERLLLAGGFGAALRPESAGRIGLLPAGLVRRTQPVGNAALRGAARLLCHPERLEELRTLCKRCKVLELSTDPWFSEAFLDAMALEEWRDGAGGISSL